MLIEPMVHVLLEMQSDCAYSMRITCALFASIGAILTKKAVNLSVDESLIAEAREHRINLSQTLERAVISELREVKRARWLEDNRAAITFYNRRIETEGAFSDEVRQF